MSWKRKKLFVILLFTKLNNGHWNVKLVWFSTAMLKIKKYNEDAKCNCDNYI